ncbi:MAG: hypothetical protein JWM02_3568 [Frankiales bacterium]|nr:hypothetical protein [Frankiales bacterium]
MVRFVEHIVTELAPAPATFARHFALVRAYVRSEAGSHSALMEAANADPEGMTTSIVALGAVLLDIASGAFHLTPDEMMEKLADGVSRISGEGPAQPAL